MEWVWDVLRVAGMALLILGGWSVADSLARVAAALEGRKANS